MAIIDSGPVVLHPVFAFPKEDPHAKEKDELIQHLIGLLKANNLIESVNIKEDGRIDVITKD